MIIPCIIHPFDLSFLSTIDMLFVGFTSSQYPQYIPISKSKS